MPIRKDWFTMAELIVAMSIMAIFFVAWISSFQTFFSNQEMKSVWSKMISIIDDLDRQVKAWDISSYSADFSSWSAYILVDKDFYRWDYLFSFTWVDLTSLSWTLMTGTNWTWVWSLDTYIDWKLNDIYTLNWTNKSMSMSFSWKIFYENVFIRWDMEWNRTNEIDILNLYPDKSFESQGTVSKPYVESVSGSLLYDGVRVTNILWRKTMSAYKSSWATQDVEDIDLTIAKNSKEYTFKLTK